MNNKKEWTLKYSIIDIGAGIDYRYIKIFAPKLQAAGLTYYAVEIDFDARERIKAGLRNRNLEDTVELFESVDELLAHFVNYPPKEKFTVICTEVLEHNEFTEAQKLVNKVCKHIPFDQFIVTVPNAEFNQFYGLEGFRHDDHKWEANNLSLANLFSGLNSAHWNKKVSDVGDTVNDIPVTFGVQVKKNI